MIGDDFGAFVGLHFILPLLQFPVDLLIEGLQILSVEFPVVRINIHQVVIDIFCDLFASYRVLPEVRIAVYMDIALFAAYLGGNIFQFDPFRGLNITGTAPLNFTVA